MKNFWKLLEEKGKWFTLQALMISVPTNMSWIYRWLKEPETLNNELLIGGLALNLVAFVYAILPSYIKFKAKDFELEIKD